MRYLVAAAWLLMASVAAESQVRVWEEDVVIPTYPLGRDDVTPHFYELEGSVIYPYTMQDNLTTDCPSPTSRRDSSVSATTCWLADTARLRHNGVFPC